MLAQKHTYINTNRSICIYRERGVGNYRNLERETSSGEGRESLRLGPKLPFFMSDLDLCFKFCLC